MKRSQPIHYETSEYGTCALLTYEQFSTLFTPEDLAKGEKRGEMKTRGMWQLPVSYTALAVNKNAQLIYGYRSMTHIQQLGYEIEGITSVNGKRVSCFSSSLLIQLPDGKLFSAAILYIRSGELD